MAKIIHDKFSAIPDKMARNYFRNKEKGLCRCGRPLEPSYSACTACRKLRKEWYEKHKKLKPKPYKHTPRPSKYSQFIT